MEKKICPNGHEYDPAVNGFCPVCGQAAQAAQTDSMASIFDGFGDDEGSAPAAAAQPDSAPFMTVYGSFDDYDNSTPPPIRTINGGGDSDPLPQVAPPPVRSMKPIPGQPAVTPGQPQVQPRPGFPNNAPQAVPLNNLNQQGAYMNGMPPMMPGQAPMQAQPQGQPMQPQAIPPYRRAQSLHNQPGTYSNRPQAPQQPGSAQPQNRPQAYGVPLRNTQTPQTTPPPFGVPINTAPAHQQVPTFGVPLQGQPQSQQFRMPQFGQQFGQPAQNADMQMNFEPAGYTRNMSMGDFAPPTPPPPPPGYRRRRCCRSDDQYPRRSRASRGLSARSRRECQGRDVHRPRRRQYFRQERQGCDVPYRPQIQQESSPRSAGCRFLRCEEPQIHHKPRSRRYERDLY